MNSQLSDISSWDEAYVRNLPRGEFDWIDLKASRWLDLSSDCLAKLSKYVSAYANYDGGYLVIGVTDPRPGAALQLDEGVSLTLKSDLKGWLEDIIPGLTDPRIERLNVHVISRTGATSQADRALVVLHIPPSARAPHQAVDHKYYTRVGTKLSPLGHQALLDIVNRATNPAVATQLFVNIHPHGGKHNIFWRVTNLTNVFARYVMTRIHVPVNIAGNRIWFEHEQLQVRDDGQWVWPLIASNHLAQPLFPHGTMSRRFEFEFRGPALDKPTPSTLHFQTFADRMPPIEGDVLMADALSTTRTKDAEVRLEHKSPSDAEAGRGE